MPFKTRASIDPNQHKGLILLNSITGNPLVATGLSLTNSQPIHVAIVDGAGSQVTSFGGTGGTSSSFGSAFPATGTAAGAIDASGNMAGLNLDGSGNLKVSGSLSVGGTTDNSAFTAGTTTGTPTMGFYHSTIDTVTDGRAAAVGITNKRAMLVTLQTSAGADTGVAASPLQVSLANTAANATAVKVDGSAVTQPISGTVTIGAGAAVIGHVITDTGSTTAVTGNVTVIQGTGSNLHTVVDSGTITTVSTLTGTTTLTPGTGATNLGKAEDAASASGDVGVGMLVLQQATPGDNAGTDGDYAFPQMSAGRIWTSSKIDTALPAGANVIGHVITDTGSTTAVTGTVTISGAVTEAILDAALISQEANTSGVKGLTVFGAVTTNAPTYTTAKSDALSLDTSGLLRVSLKDTPANTNKLLVTADAITFASPQHIIADSGTISTITNVVHVDDNAGSLTVDNGGTFAVQATVAAGATNIAKAEDVASADADVGVPALAVRKASPANTSGTDGDYEFLQMSAGRLWASATIDAALPAGTAVIGKVSIDQTTPGTTNLVALTAETTKVIGVTRTSDGAGNLLTSNSSTYTAKFGLDANILGTLGTAFSTAGKVDVKGADGDVFVRQTTGSNLHTVLDSGTLTTLTTLTGITNTVVTDDLAAAATGSAVPANAHYQGLNAQTALPAAASAGNLTGETGDKFGRQVMLNNAMRDIMGTQTTTITASTSETTIITAIASTFNDLVSVFISNTSATAARVDIRDTTAGSVIFQLYIPAGDMRGLSLTTPWPQSAVNTNWTATSSTSVTDLRISALFIKNK